MRVLGKFTWYSYYFDPSDAGACIQVKEMFGYKWGLLRVSGGTTTAGWSGEVGNESPIVAVRIMGHDIDVLAEFRVSGVRYFDLWEFFSEDQVREIFDAALAESPEMRGIVDSRLEVLSKSESPSSSGGLPDVDEWEGSGFRELGDGTVIFKVEITPKPFEESFDIRLGRALKSYG